MNALVHKLGLSPTLSFHDVYSLDDPSLLAFVPRPVQALLLVFPVTETYEKARKEEDESLPEYAGSGETEEVLWFKQTIRNACGMMGLLHSVCNGGAREMIGEFKTPIADPEADNPTRPGFFALPFNLPSPTFIARAARPAA